MPKVITMKPRMMYQSERIEAIPVCLLLNWYEVTSKNTPGKMKFVMDSLNAPIIPNTTVMSSKKSAAEPSKNMMIITMVECVYSLTRSSIGLPLSPYPSSSSYPSICFETVCALNSSTKLSVQTLRGWKLNGSAHRNIIRNSSFATEEIQSAFESKLTKMFWSMLFMPKHLMASHANET